MNPSNFGCFKFLYSRRVSSRYKQAMSKPKIVAFAGSSRAGSYNKQLLAIAVDAARTAGADVYVVDLRELALPLFDQDAEAASGLPEGAKRLKALMSESDALLIASPEYNSTITPLLKNALDWVSRVESEQEAPLLAFRGKAAALISASPGALGGLRGLVTLRSMLGNIGVILLPEQVSIPAAYDAFDASGALKDAGKAEQVRDVARGLVKLAQSLHPAS